MSEQQRTSGDSWQRLSYDPVAYETDLRQSTNPMRYRLDPIYSNGCGKVCRAGDIGYIGRIGASIEKKHSLIDTDSELKLLNYRATKAPQFKYRPDGKQSSDKTGYPGPEAGGIQSELMDQDKYRDASDKWHFPECNNQLRTEYTRVTNPICDLKGTGVNRFQPLCLDPQHPSRWEHPSEIGINYRMIAKDNHRPCIPKPMCQSGVLPPAQADAVKNGTGTFTNGTYAASDGVDPNGIREGLPKQKITLTYCTAASGDYGHNLFCDKTYKPE